MEFQGGVGYKVLLIKKGVISKGMECNDIYIVIPCIHCLSLIFDFEIVWVIRIQRNYVPSRLHKEATHIYEHFKYEYFKKRSI